MATILITSLQSAASQINNAKVGDTVDFQGLNGSFSIDPMDGVTYIGNGAKLTGIAGKAVFYGSAMHDASFSGFQFVNAAFSFATMKNVSVTNNLFTFTASATAIYLWTSAPPDSSKANPAAWNAAMTPAATNVQITDNDFAGPANYIGQVEAIHVRLDTPAPPGADNGPGKSTGFVFSRNRMRGISRCGLEEQGGGTGSLIEDNIFETPTLTGNPAIDSGSMSYSTADDASVGKIVRRNKATGTRSVTTGIEFAGHAGQCVDNYIEGVNASIVVQTGNNGTVTGNQIVNCAALPAVGGTHPGLNMPDASNGQNVKLTWDINRPWPISSSPTPTPTGGTVSAATYTGAVKNGQAVLSDGTLDRSTSSVASVFEVNGVWYQQTVTGRVWTLPGTNATDVTGKISPPTPTPPATTRPAPTPVVPASVNVTVTVGGTTYAGSVPKQ